MDVGSIAGRVCVAYFWARSMNIDGTCDTRSTLRGSEVGISEYRVKDVDCSAEQQARSASGKPFELLFGSWCRIEPRTDVTADKAVLHATA
jgi:hypothetical protein